VPIRELLNLNSGVETAEYTRPTQVKWFTWFADQEQEFLVCHWQNPPKKKGRRERIRTGLRDN
jgi:hypothetical protein